MPRRGASRGGAAPRRLSPGGAMEQAMAEANSLYGSIINDVEVPLQEGMTPQDMERFQAKQIAVAAPWRNVMEGYPRVTISGTSHCSVTS